MSKEGPNPSGLCQCGCGRPTPLATHTSRSRGLVKGKPTAYFPGHSSRWKDHDSGKGPNPSGLCMCGCGKPAPIATKTNRQFGHVKGQPVRFIKGHSNCIAPHNSYCVDPETGCWVWQGHLHNGYGRMLTPEGVVRPAHTVFYETKFGPLPEGMEPDHLCRNRECVNPDHLEPVSRRVNCRRGAKAKLTAEQVARIKALLRSCSSSQRAIASQFGVSESAICHIASGRCWEEIEPCV